MFVQASMRGGLGVEPHEDLETRPAPSVRSITTLRPCRGSPSAGVALGTRPGGHLRICCAATGAEAAMAGCAIYFKEIRFV